MLASETIRRVAELVDASDLKSEGLDREGSIPSTPTKFVENEMSEKRYEVREGAMGFIIWDNFENRIHSNCSDLKHCRTLCGVLNDTEEGITAKISDPVNHPLHYTNGTIECIDAIKSALTKEEFIGHCRATAIKYLWRTGLKGDPVEDLKKAVWYINKAIEAHNEQ